MSKWHGLGAWSHTSGDPCTRGSPVYQGYDSWSCSTYIKLGQFIASSPTLFPPEYVLEMQQCLDSAPPVPWDVIKCDPSPTPVQGPLRQH